MTTRRSARTWALGTVLIAATALATTATASSATTADPPGGSSRASATSAITGPSGSTKAGLPRAAGAPPTTAPSVRHARARTDTGPAQRALALGASPCADGSGALCGQFTVPLDRRHPDGRTAKIDFTLLVHSDPGEATSTIWWNGGGPGPSTTRQDAWVPGYLFSGLLGSFDVLFTDVRGTGSTAPACPSMQDFSGYYPGVANHAAYAACAASIADRITTYGSADSASDLDELRAALGIPKLDIVGNSYGAQPATAYALRFPQRTRSLVISSGIDSETTLSSKMTSSAAAFDRIITRLCTRSPACSAQIGDAADALAAGIRRLHRAPLVGESVSANHPDVVQHVRLTEGMLFTLLEESDNTFMTAAGEAPAALIALGRGDTAPALRLAADATDIFNVTPYGVEPEFDSAGGYSAISCTDYRLPWRPGLALARRIDAAAATVRDLDLDAWSAPSIVRTPEYADWEQLINCNQWPDVRADRPVPSGATYPRVPTLVMTSDLDPRVPLEDATRIAARWPRGQLLDIGEGLHGAAFWSCGPDRLQAFLRAPGSRQAPCPKADFPSYRAVGEFPVTSDQARPLRVDDATVDRTTRHERQLAAVALETALDANSVSTRQSFLGTGAGLRGGSATSSGDDTEFRITLQGDRFASDVAVDGTMLFPFDGSAQSIDITFTADDGSTGHLLVSGSWAQGRSAGDPRILPVTGVIDGHAVSLLLPL